ncbi:MAG: hypothetical protein VCB42_01440 [Myxococcota bacterium]
MSFPLRVLAGFLGLAVFFLAAGPGVASADDCIAVEDSGADPDPEDDEPPGFVDFNLCAGIHTLDPTGTFFLAVHVAAPGASYAEHETWLLESDNAEEWSLVPGFERFIGSVPEVITRGSEILLYNPGKMRAYDLESGTVRGATASITTAEGETVSYVDPSAWLDDQGRIVLFFLNSTDTPPGEDPAAGSDPKDFDSALEVEGSLGTEFVLSEGHRIQVQGSDPDIFFDGEQFVLYVSRGQSTLVFVSETLEGEYAAIEGLEGDSFLTHKGGIPAGHYDESSASYWTYVHSNTGAGTVVRLAVHDSLSSTLGEEAFETLLAGEDLGYDSDHGVESPSFAVNTAVPEAGAAAAALSALGSLALLADRRSSRPRRSSAER